MTTLLAAPRVSVPHPPLTAADYLIVFSADSVPYRPTKTHTFAALVRAEEAPTGPPRLAALHSISWLPATLAVRAFAVRPERGRNVPLGETLDLYTRYGRRVCAWGPYRVRAGLADTFRERVAAVEGSFRYKAACLTSPRDVCDCARAVEEMARPDRRYIGVFGYGAAASGSAVRTFAPFLVEPQRTHDWVGVLAGVADYPIAWRSFGDYTTPGDQWRSASGLAGRILKAFGGIVPWRSPASRRSTRSAR